MNQASANALLKIAAYFEGLEERILLDARNIESIERTGRSAVRERRELRRRIAAYDEQVEAFRGRAARFAEHPMWRRLDVLSQRLRA
ncbi:MAG: hypothetical protein RIT81_13055 [Deltaproteobacteria bacterium]